MSKFPRGVDMSPEVEEDLKRFAIETQKEVEKAYRNKLLYGTWNNPYLESEYKGEWVLPIEYKLTYEEVKRESFPLGKYLDLLEGDEE